MVDKEAVDDVYLCYKQSKKKTAGVTIHNKRIFTWLSSWLSTHHKSLKLDVLVPPFPSFLCVIESLTPVPHFRSFVINASSSSLLATLLPYLYLPTITPPSYVFPLISFISYTLYLPFFNLLPCSLPSTAPAREFDALATLASRAWSESQAA